MFNSVTDDGEYQVIGETHWQLLENASEDLVVKIYGFKYVRARALIFHLASVLLCGVPYLFISWYPKRSLIKYAKCCLATADLVCVTDNEGSFKMEEIKEVDINLANARENRLRYFIYQHTRFIWLKDQRMFVNVITLNEKLTINHLMDNTLGINKRQQAELTKLYGPNTIEVEVKSYWSLFVNEVFNPFYLFQVFSIILWSLDEYYHYAGCVLAISTFSCGLSLTQTKKQSLSLRNMVMSSMASSVSVVRPARGGGREECVVQAGRLVPGDVLLLPPGGCVMPCDAMLLTGTCIVNEGMLTGESVPVMKAPPNMSAEIYSTETHKRHTLFSGTHVIQTRFYGNNQVLAKVVRTGFYTAKGELVKSILFPKPVGFQFYKDSAKFIIFLFCIAAMGMIYCVWLYVERQTPLSTIILRTLDIITIVVPPALPAAMTAGTICSQSRLKKKEIFCISPPRINICGKLQVVCFDKTGTLTEDGLDLYAVIPWWGEGDTFGQLVREVPSLPPTSPLMQALAACHSLTSVDGQLTGDPLDLQMFQATNWVLEEPGSENTRYDNLAPAVVKPASTNESALNNLDDLDPLTMEIPYEIGLLRRFHFSSTQQSMGVIARVLGQPEMVYFVKGAPEKVAGMCRPESLPPNFNAILNEYASNGFRVIGLGHKKLHRKMKWVDAQRIKREQLECDMTFLGLLIMQNSLKPETTQIIRDLYKANMKMAMVTGDNIMTAMSVARVCGMIPPQDKMLLISTSPHTANGQRPALVMEVVGEGSVGHTKSLLGSEQYSLALEGKTWAAIRHYYPEHMPLILAKGVVFGRFGPDQKTQLITGLQGEGWVVGMCGDGANDCGALKAAHIGISLSQAEASVAAPFTSREQNISCVKHLTLEGRCALSTSFAIFKYMAMYSLIQFISVLILYNMYSILGNMQFLYIDLVLTTMLAMSMGRAGPNKVLTPHWPPVSLLSPTTTVPLVLQVSLCLLTQLAAFCLLHAQPWYTPIEAGPDQEEVLCWDNTTIFIVSSYQYLILACVYSKGKPFREPFCCNYYMVASLVTLMVTTTLMLVCPWKLLSEWMEVEMFDWRESGQNIFRVYLLIIPAAHFVVSLAIEMALSEGGKIVRVIRSLVHKKLPPDVESAACSMQGSHWLDALKDDAQPC